MDSKEYELIKKIIDKTDDLVDLMMIDNYLQTRIEQIKENENNKKIK